MRPVPALEQKSGLKGDFLFGAAYGAASLSCTLPILLGITGTVMSGGVLNSAANFTAFALGMGTVFTALAVAAALSGDGLAQHFKRILPYINRISGVLVTAAGLYVTYYWGFALFKPQIPGAYNIIMTGDRLSGTLRSWLSSDTGEIIIISLFATLIAALAWSGLRRLTAPRNGPGIQ